MWTMDMLIIFLLFQVFILTQMKKNAENVQIVCNRAKNYVKENLTQDMILHHGQHAQVCRHCEYWPYSAAEPPASVCLFFSLLIYNQVTHYQ